MMLAEAPQVLIALEQSGLARGDPAIDLGLSRPPMSATSWR